MKRKAGYEAQGDIIDRAIESNKKIREVKAGLLLSRDSIRFKSMRGGIGRRCRN
jgi:hypothetical protein